MRYDKSITSFLFAFLGVLFTLTSRSLISSFLGFGLGFGLESSFLLLEDFFVLLDGFGVHLDGGVAESAVVTIPMLSHEDSGSA